MQAFTYRNHQLHAEDVPLSLIAATYGTPCFVYSRAALEERLRAYQAPLAGRAHLICYAVKANANLAVLNVLARMGAGFDIVSGGELTRVLEAGGDPDKILFSGVGKRVEEMQQALEAGIHCFNVESLPELERLSAVAEHMDKVARISLRVNPDVDAQTHPYISTGLKDNKFGIAIEEAEAFYVKASTLPSIDVIGVDCHIGSQLTTLAPFLDALDRLLLLIDRLAARGIAIRHLDLGGGLGVRYQEETPPEPHAYIDAVLQKIGSRNLTLVFEPGRSIVANAGVMLSTVEYLKPTASKNFAILDGAMNDIIRPALYQAVMDIVPVVQAPATREVLPWDLVGPVCESADFLGRNRLLALAAGDVLAVRSAGAYCFAMSSNYNTRNRAAEVMVDGAKHTLVRRRETYADQLALESILE
ncbi:MAG: diaminopimelate decarboxylase [Pseudomonadales bacterium]|jgi:diaminopimelate decarboxylase|nr:diaminopimelate decarboxylase [Pseudomonadales bacterium]